MGMVNFLVKGGGRHEFSMMDSGRERVPRIARMLRAACVNFGLKPGEVMVFPDGQISNNGASGPLELTVCFSEDILDKLAPKIDPENSEERSDSALRRFVQAMGETAVRLGPENGWPPRHVRAKVSGSDVSWSG